MPGENQFYKAREGPRKDPHIDLNEVPTIQDVYLDIERAKKPIIKLIIETLFQVGYRNRELRFARVKDFDFEKGTVSIPSRINDLAGEQLKIILSTERKTCHARLSIDPQTGKKKYCKKNYSLAQEQCPACKNTRHAAPYLKVAKANTQGVVQILNDAWAHKIKAWIMTNKLEPFDFIFSHKKAGHKVPYSERQIEYWIKSVRAAHHPHIYRHAKAVWMLTEGEYERDDVKTELRHSSIQTTIDYYGKIPTKMYRERIKAGKRQSMIN